MRSKASHSQSNQGQRFETRPSPLPPGEGGRRPGEGRRAATAVSPSPPQVRLAAPPALLRISMLLRTTRNAFCRTRHRRPDLTRTPFFLNHLSRCNAIFSGSICNRASAPRQADNGTQAAHLARGRSKLTFCIESATSGAGDSTLAIAGSSRMTASRFASATPARGPELGRRRAGPYASRLPIELGMPLASWMWSVAWVPGRDGQEVGWQTSHRHNPLKRPRATSFSWKETRLL